VGKQVSKQHIKQQQFVGNFWNDGGQLQKRNGQLQKKNVSMDHWWAQVLSVDSSIKKSSRYQAATIRR
jgi:hypothetical protein